MKRSDALILKYVRLKSAVKIAVKQSNALIFKYVRVSYYYPKFQKD